MRELPLNDLLALIPKSRDESITAQSLAKMAYVSEPFIRKKINEARTIGIPICSTKKGYYLSEECGEIAKTIRSLTNRINTQLKAIDGLANKIVQLEKEVKKEKEVKGCDNCRYGRGGDTVPCHKCIASYDSATNTHGTPSHWQPKKESEDTE